MCDALVEWVVRFESTQRTALYGAHELATAQADTQRQFYGPVLEILECWKNAGIVPANEMGERRVGWEAFRWDVHAVSGGDCCGFIACTLILHGKGRCNHVCWFQLQCGATLLWDGA